MIRDPIYNGVVNQLSAMIAEGTVNVVSRGFVMWDEASAQPAVYIVPVNEEAIYKMNLPTKWIIHLDLYVYVKWVDSISQGVTALAYVMDRIEYYLSPVGPNGIKQGNGAVNNLGGLAQYCALNGAADISGGFLGNNQTVAKMPVEILVA